MCEYCDYSRKPVRTEVDGYAWLELTPDDSEQPEGFLLDVHDKWFDDIRYTFIVPCCPMCGATAKEATGAWL